MSDSNPADILLNQQDPEVLSDPTTLYNEMVSKCPVVKGSDGNWILGGYDDIKALLGNDGKLWFREPTMPMVIGSSSESDLRKTLFVRTMGDMLLTRDPPNHTRLRNIIAKAFMVRDVETRRPRITEIVNKLIDKMIAADRHQADLLKEYTMPLPVQVITDMLGFSVDYEDFLEHYTDIVVAMGGPGEKTPSMIAEAETMTQKFRDIVAGIVDERRDHPGDDLLSALIAAEDEGGKLSFDELVATCIMLHVAGHETTGNLIADAVALLLTHREQWELLCNDVSLIPQAVEEVLRYSGSARICQPRVAKTDMVFSGVTIPAGEQVIPVQAIANRDPEKFTDPDRFDILRSPNKHIAFGFGPHFCVGNALARLETRVALEVLTQRLPSLELQSQDLQWRPVFQVRALKTLPVRW